MKLRLTLFVKPIMLLLFVYSSFSQEISTNSPSTHDKYFGSNSSDNFDVKGVNKTVKKTPQQTWIEQQILNLKKDGKPGDRERISDLNNQLEKISGNTVTRFIPNYGGSMTYVNKPVENTLNDEISNIRLYNNTAREIKGMATCTEQTGANAGRIWIFYNFSAGTTSPDSFKVIYSVNGGSSWVTYVTGNIRPLDKVNYDDLDMELIENTSGSKYLMVVYGQRANGGTGRWFTGGLIINVTSFNGSFFDLSWPGDDPAKRYYNIRITSDNASYPATAYIYLVCSFDSLNTGNVRVNTQKYARCLNPYMVNPSFTYQGQKFWWYNTSNPANYERTLYSDIAYFKNGTGDSVIVSFSNVPDSTLNFLFKSRYKRESLKRERRHQARAVRNRQHMKQWARLSSNGNGNGSVICVFREFTGENWNVKYFRTTNYGDFSDVNQSILWGSNVNTNYQPDIAGRRNGDSHYFTFNTVSTEDSVHYIRVTATGSTTHTQRVNLASSVSGSQGSKPGIRYSDSDSCFTVYTESGPYNIWVALGCSGAPTGISGNSNQIPQAYVLYQNYPNPFNPATTIRYDVPAAGLVKLVVYDILGKEIASPVNEIKTPGSYLISFDASNLPSGVYFYKITEGNFTETRKMLLVK